MESRLRPGRRCYAAAAGAVLVMLALLPGPGAATASRPALTTTPQDLGWRYYGNDLGNTRFQDVDQINPFNVASLRPAWVFHTGVLDPATSFEDSPIVVNGTMYISTGLDDVFALNAATGAMEWAYHPEAAMPPLSKLSICCGEDSRGVAYGDGLIFLAILGRATGKPLFSSLLPRRRCPPSRPGRTRGRPSPSPPSSR